MRRNEEFAVLRNGSMPSLATEKTHSSISTGEAVIQIDDPTRLPVQASEQAEAASKLIYDHLNTMINSSQAYELHHFILGP